MGRDSIEREERDVWGKSKGQRSVMMVDARYRLQIHRYCERSSLRSCCEKKCEAVLEGIK